MARVYLAGPIHGMTDLECKAWRTEAAALLSVHDVEFIDPMSRDFRGLEEDAVDELVEADKGDIEQADVVLVNANRPGWGTAMEVFYANSLGKQVVAFSNSPSISPWLRCHTSAIFGTLHEALAGIVLGECVGMR
jgi:nucleoside 2-deoxyribosyltransferase